MVDTSLPITSAHRPSFLGKVRQGEMASLLSLKQVCRNTQYQYLGSLALSQPINPLLSSPFGWPVYEKIELWSLSLIQATTDLCLHYPSSLKRSPSSCLESCRALTFVSERDHPLINPPEQ